MITGTGTNIGLRNYRYLLNNDRFWNAMFNTVKYAAFKLTVDTTLALLIAVMLDRNIPGKRFLRASYFSPVVVPVVASSLIWIWFYDPSVGPFNQILSFLGLPTSRWLFHENTALLSILIFSVWKGVGYNMILFLSGLQNIPDSYLEAARMDGATEMKVFFKIKLPLLRPITSFIIMMGVINSFKVFTEINVMTPDGGPLGSTTLIVNYIYDQAFTSGRMGRASAAALLLFVVIFLLTELQRAINAKKHVDLV
ncbi:MAG TPA: sugar ABC transporter permease, partial [Clostridia bacterium]|nr:sugar ABC transporter permease [Clostridia bacterium]